MCRVMNNYSGVECTVRCNQEKMTIKKYLYFHKNIDMCLCDHSGIEAIKSLAERYFNLGKRLHLKHLSIECRYLLNSMGDSVVISIIEEPHSRILPSSSERQRLEIATKSPATMDDTESTVG